MGEAVHLAWEAFSGKLPDFPGINRYTRIDVALGKRGGGLGVAVVALRPRDEGTLVAGWL